MAFKRTTLEFNIQTRGVKINLCWRRLFNVDALGPVLCEDLIFSRGHAPTLERAVSHEPRRPSAARLSSENFIRGLTVINMYVVYIEILNTLPFPELMAIPN